MYIDTIFALYWYIDVFFFLTHLYCLVGSLSLIVWTHAVSGVLYACVLYFYICTCLGQLGMFHMERHSRNTIVVIVVAVVVVVVIVLLLLLLSSSSSSSSSSQEWVTWGLTHAFIQ